MKIHYMSAVAVSLCLSGYQATKEAGTQAPETQAASTATIPNATAYAASAAAAGTPAQCAMQIASPPPKPAKGADFGSAAAKT